MMNKQTLVLIDSDSLFYQSSRDTLEESISVFKEKLQNCLKRTSANYWQGFVTVGKNFRYSIDSDYKKNRIGKDKPKWFKTLREWAISEYNLVKCEKWEADDEVVYLYNQNLCISDDHIEPEDTLKSALSYTKSEGHPIFTWEKLNVIIASPDKDITSIVPKCFNYSYKLEDRNNPDSVVKGFWTETSNTQSEYFKWKQMIMGDSSDGVSCLEGIGEKGAEKILHAKGDILESTVFEKYIDFYGLSKGIYEFQKNYRLLHLLENNEDFMRECGEIPMTPRFNSVEKQEQQEEEILF